MTGNHADNRNGYLSNTSLMPHRDTELFRPWPEESSLSIHKNTYLVCKTYKILTPASFDKFAKLCWRWATPHQDTQACPLSRNWLRTTPACCMLRQLHDSHLKPQVDTFTAYSCCNIAWPEFTRNAVNLKTPRSSNLLTRSHPYSYKFQC